MFCERDIKIETSIVILICIGLTAGFISGLFGSGGGVLFVPALVYLLGFSQHKAIGTSLLILLPPVGLGAVVEYYRHGNVDWKAAIVVACGVFVGAWLGALVSNKMGGAVLRLLFGIFVVFLGCYTVYGALKKMTPANGEAGIRALAPPHDSH